MQIIIPAERRTHKEVHSHACPLHAKNKCGHKSNEFCNACIFSEDNECCQMTIRGTYLDYHIYPCVGCQSYWRKHYGGEMLVDALVNLEQAARHAHLAPSKHLDAREEYEAETNDEVKDLVHERKRI